MSYALVGSNTQEYAKIGESTLKVCNAYLISCFKGRVLQLNDELTTSAQVVYELLERNFSVRITLLKAPSALLTRLLTGILLFPKFLLAAAGKFDREGAACIDSGNVTVGSLNWFMKRLTYVIKNIPQRAPLAQVLTNVYEDTEDCRVFMGSVKNLTTAKQWRVILENNWIVAPPCCDKGPCNYEIPFPGPSPEWVAAEAKAKASSFEVVRCSLEFIALVFIVCQLWRIFSANREVIEQKVKDFSSAAGEFSAGVGRSVWTAIGRSSTRPKDSESRVGLCGESANSDSISQTDSGENANGGGTSRQRSALEQVNSPV